jgi:hypothetical protein
MLKRHSKNSTKKQGDKIRKEENLEKEYEGR